MAEQQGQEKTEQPTERKRQKARDEGQATFSKELSSAALLGAATLTLYFASAWLLDGFRELMRGSFTELRPEQDFTITVLYRTVGDAFSAMAPVLLVLSVVIVSVAFLSSVIQVGFRFTLKPLAPKFSKISPLTGIKRLF
ncbi:MAG: EscU/YscU/HrcU family type III secretion system export apparatus switch protein, partial [SAR324 cluster bacterium]|nr:EscU/YscU/HrcU family type III secretion system export apparatus switch protein [SAR324 cluster bacterium]